MINFWNNLKKPFFCLAPMADVTDPAFRRLIAKYGKPDVTWTEFVSADGLCHPVGREKLMLDLAFTEAERPIVAQLFSSNPDHMRIAAKLCADMGYDGVDINMGCPDRTIEKQGCGAAMIKTPERALEIIQAAREGAPNLPISVKTRVGYSKEDIDGWIALLLKQKLPALTVHARTRKEMSDVPAHWDYISRIVKLRDELSPETLIIGNGDVRDMQDGSEKAEETGCDGIMIGRACFGNPWIFNTTPPASRGTPPINRRRHPLVNFFRKLFYKDFDDYVTEKRYWLHNQPNVPLEQKLRTLVEHSKMFCELLPHKNFATMKKHYKAYCTGFPGAKELRIKLMESKDVGEVEQIIDEFLK